MQQRPFGRLGQVSALTLGGGGIGSVWGATERSEAVATVRAAVDAGVTLLDVAPTYGPGEAELVVGEAFAGALPDGLRVCTKVELPDAEPAALERRLEASLHESLERLRLDRVDLLLLHSQLQPDEGPTGPRLLSASPFREVVRPALARLVARGDVGAWGLTGVGWPPLLVEVLGEEPRPHAIQCVANALDLSGDVWVFGDAGRPDNAGVRARAVGLGVPVVGIRAVAAGSLTDTLDREVEPDHPAARDFAVAAGFRALAAERGEPAALLAHRYALSLPDVATVVLGVKNRAELHECLAAEAAGPLDPATMRRLAALAPS